MILVTDMVKTRLRVDLTPVNSTVKNFHNYLRDRWRLPSHMNDIMLKRPSVWWLDLMSARDLMLAHDTAKKAGNVLREQ